MSRTLDQVVTAAAAELMAVTATDAADGCTRVLADVVDHLAVDVSFLRHNDHDIHATRLVAEWPAREYVPDPDPIGLIFFADADPVFKMAEHLKTPLILRPEPENDDYQRNIEAGTGVPAVSMACVPLLSGEVTSGILGFIKAGDRAWTDEELNALQAIATLFAQLQARIDAEEQLQYLAEHDDLSGLLNRRALISHLDRRLAAGNPGPVAVLFLDLDRLKTVNDYLGHNAGDQFIKLFAERLKAGSDAPATIARVGGDEFVVVPDDSMSVEEAASFARRLQTWLHRRVVIDGEMLARTVSVGVAVGAPGQDTTSDLLRRADQAALSAKGAGGSKTAVFTSEMAAQHAIRNDIELHLEGVIDEAGSAVVLHYLPEVDMRTGEVLGTEALVRWRHPTRGLLLPDSFIGVAESINLAGKLGRLVMRSACEDFANWRARGAVGDAILRINVSPVQLVSDGFAATVAGILGDFGLDGPSVCLEITESMVVQDIGATRHTLAALKDVGVQIAIDDFGTGYSVLTHLKSLPVDTLKIDRSFVRDLGDSPGDLAIVRAILALADAFELQVVAEGVETSAAARTLLALGCPRAQGFMLSRPIDARAMESMFAARRLPIDLDSDLRADAGNGHHH